MSREQLGNAQQEVLRRFHPKDIVALFSVRYHIVTDIERPFASYSRKEYPWLLGGTDPREVIEFAKKQNARSILYTDGWLLDCDRDLADELVIIP